MLNFLSLYGFDIVTKAVSLAAYGWMVYRSMVILRHPENEVTVFFRTRTRNSVILYMTLTMLLPLLAALNLTLTYGGTVALLHLGCCLMVGAAFDHRRSDGWLHQLNFSEMLMNFFPAAFPQQEEILPDPLKEKATAEVNKALVEGLLQRQG